MTKQRALFLLAILVLVDLVLINQTWITGTVGEAQSEIELAGTAVSALLSPLLILAILTVFIGFYLKPKFIALLLIIEAGLLSATELPLLLAQSRPTNPLARSGLVEKITGQTGTIEELGYQITTVTVSPALIISIIAIAVTALWALISAFIVWRSKSAPRQTRKQSQHKTASGKKPRSSFDLWDSQR